jgi:hypothetical protein
VTRQPWADDVPVQVLSEPAEKPVKPVKPAEQPEAT